MIQVFSGARNVARPSSWQICWQVRSPGQLEFTPAACCPNQTVSACFDNSKEGPLRILEAIPLDHPHYGKWRHMAPRDLERTPCRHPCGTENSRFQRQRSPVPIPSSCSGCLVLFPLVSSRRTAFISNSRVYCFLGFFTLSLRLWNYAMGSLILVSTDPGEDQFPSRVMRSSGRSCRIRSNQVS